MGEYWVFLIQKMAKIFVKCLLRKVMVVNIGVVKKSPGHRSIAWTYLDGLRRLFLEIRKKLGQEVKKDVFYRMIQLLLEMKPGQPDVFPRIKNILNIENLLKR